MDGGVDFPLQDLLCTLNSQRRHLGAQCVACLADLLLCIRVGGSDDTRCFFRSGTLCFFNDRLGALLGVADALLSSVVGGSQFCLHALFSGSHFQLAALGGSQTVRDLLGALV